MKKRLFLLMLAGLMAFSLCACKKEGPKGINSNFGSNEKDLVVFNDLSVQDVMTADFDTKKDDKDEYVSYLQEELDAYNAGASFVPQTAAEGEEDNFTPHFTVPVSVASCTVDKNVINQQLLYATASDYVAYNQEIIESRGGNTLQAGKLTSADASVTGASLIDPDDKNGGFVDIQEILTGKNADNYCYVICNFEAAIYLEGEVAGFTSTGVYDSTKDCVTVPAGKTVVILFKK